jgi:hypothetical protein
MREVCSSIQTPAITLYSTFARSAENLHSIRPSHLWPHSISLRYNQQTPVLPAPITTPQSASFATKLNKSKDIMYYLVHTPHHPRPYLSTVSFIANDFANWGCQVTCHANNSAYITEVRYQEKRNRPGSRRIELMEVWAKEVLARKSQQQPQDDNTNRTDTLAARKARASAFAQDFVSGLSAFGTPPIFHSPKCKSLTDARISNRRTQSPPQ